MFALSDECGESYAVVPVVLLILQGLSSTLVLPTDFQDAVVLFCQGTDRFCVVSGSSLCHTKYFEWAHLPQGTF